MGASVAKSGVPFLSTIEGEYQLNMETAKATEADAKFNAGQRMVQAERLMGSQVAAYGASGVELEGTPTDLIKFDYATAEQEAKNIIYSGKLQANTIRRSATLARNSAYTNLAKDGLMLAASMGAFSGGGAGTTTMKNGGGFDQASTGTKGYTIGENSSATGFANKGIV